MIRSFAVKAARRVLLRPPAVSPQFSFAAARAFASANTWAKHEQVVTKPDLKYTSAHVDAKVPPEDYYHGHLLADHLEYLEDVLDKTIKVEDSAAKLKKAKSTYSNVNWMEGSEIDMLFEQSQDQKEKIQAQIKQIKELLESAKKTVAVDSPDGSSDAEARAELNEVNHIIEEAAAHEDREAVLKLHQQDEANRKVIGVDAPDGQSDAVSKVDLDAVNNIINSARDKIAVLQQRHEDVENRKVTSVDAPDGMPDGFNKEELAIVKQLIDFADSHEDKAKILQRHKMEEAVRKEHARDPEHDW